MLETLIRLNLTLLESPTHLSYSRVSFDYFCEVAVVAACACAGSAGERKLAVAHALLEESNSSPLLHFFVLSIIHTPPDDTHREEAHHVQWLDGGPCLVH